MDNLPGGLPVCACHGRWNCPTSALVTINVPVPPCPSCGCEQRPMKVEITPDALAALAKKGSEARDV